ncbi:5061_t:CDS:2 [Ambispora leptoticha]|uniref:5061_t:CDS:1 n=1 Tax=Ambispora leptoticha TaxID=144679 RepID=A0A9N9G5R4_9GLOM|nr:5061_t:CDS:2 [Ambispora leptoticha]
MLCELQRAIRGAYCSWKECNELGSRITHKPISNSSSSIPASSSSISISPSSASASPSNTSGQNSSNNGSNQAAIISGYVTAFLLIISARMEVGVKYFQLKKTSREAEAAKNNEGIRL